MTGFIGMVLFTPLMTINHLIFSIMMIAYIVVAVYKYEEPDLIEMFKDGQYEDYKKKVPGLCPFMIFCKSSTTNVQTQKVQKKK
jgi:protein-S-isoprenylcysteine O-methyltransferase Ste14